MTAPVPPHAVSAAAAAMTLASMTGFGGAQGVVSLEDGRALRWAWEVKSVNGRGLDLRFRLPAGYDALEPALRLSAATLARGTVQASLSIGPEGEASPLSLDRAALEAVAAALAAVRLRIECDPPRADGILALRGVLQSADTPLGPEAQARVQAAVTEGFGEALAALQLMRAREGARLGVALSAQISSMLALVDEAEAHGPAAVAHHAAQIRASMEALLAGAEISEDRIVQEAALLAIKADVREELDRLRAHLAAARAHLIEEGPVGRSLDFLAQELVREANTLTTKAPSLDLKRIGLALKAVVDQFKEQIQNIV
jgi:uncharacterized protein (TIGR00255 family)